nr:helix-turn-helix domain-containing protein [Clostridia bacterium]
MKILHSRAIESESFLVEHRIIEAPLRDSFSPRIHEAWELFFFLKGEVTYRVEGKQYVLRSGDLVLSRPSTFHHPEPTSEAIYEAYSLLIDDGMIPNGIRRSIPEGVEVFSFGDGGRMADLFEKFKLYSDTFSGDELLTLVKCIVTEIIYNLAIEDSFTVRHATQNSLIERALDYIDENLTQIRGIDEICERLYITKSHLHHLFIKNLGVTPKRYINSKRLLMAQGLMRAGVSATEAAHMVGFEDYATFFRNYKKHFGCSPSENPKKTRLMPT